MKVIIFIIFYHFSLANATPSLSPCETNDKQILESYECKIYLGEELHDAAASNNLKKIKNLLKKGANIDHDYHRNYGPPLLMAIHNDAWDAAKLLLQKGASPTMTSNSGPNPLNYVIKRKKPNHIVLELMLKKGASLESMNSSDGVPLINAVKKDDLTSVQILLKYNASPNLFNDESPLYLATKNNNAEMVKLLLESKSDPNLTNYNLNCSELALDVAIKNNNKKIIALLEQSKAKILEHCNAEKQKIK